MQRRPRLTILVITRNAHARLARCLASVHAHPPDAEFSFLIVDNGSTDQTRAMLAAQYPAIPVITNSVNRGVAGARNQGLARAEGDYVLLLDDDTEVTAGALDALLGSMARHPAAGVIGARLIFPDGAVQASCKRLPHLTAPFLNRLGVLPGVRRLALLRDHLMDDYDHCHARPVPYCIGACQLIRVADLRQVGLLDARIFYGPEDIDFCVRMWLAGREVWYEPTATVIHHQQRLTKQKIFSLLTWRHWNGLVYWFAKYRPETRRALAEQVERRAG